jgi:cytochrome P450
VVGAYFGVPAPADATMTRWCRAIFQDIFANVQNQKLEGEAAIQAGREFRAYIDDLIKQRHAALAAGDPGPDDVLGRWLRRQAAGEDTFDDAHIPNNFIGMMMGGLDSIGMAITHVIYELLEHPAQLPGLRAASAANDDALLDRYTMEALRFRPQDTVLYRYCETPYTLAAGTARATHIPEGTMVLLAMSSGMMDEEAVGAPHEFRLDRPDDDYLHFGYGLHACLGRYIARTHIREATRAVFRLANVRAAGGVHYDGIYPTTFMVAFDPPAPATVPA